MPRKKATDSRARQNGTSAIPGLSGFSGPFYPVNRAVKRESRFFPAFAAGQSRVLPGSVRFDGFGIPVTNPEGQHSMLTAHFLTPGGKIWVLYPPKRCKGSRPQFYYRGRVNEDQANVVADELVRQFDASEHKKG